MVKLFHMADRLGGWMRRQRKRQGEPRGVLLLSCGGLGDTVLFSHVIKRFAELALPGESVSVLMRHDGAKTSFLFPDSINVQTIDFTRLRKNLSYRGQIMKGLYDANYRLVVSTDFLRHPDLDEALITACQALETVAMKARPWAKYQRALDYNGRLYGRLFDSGDLHRDKVLRWSDFANWLTGAASPPPQVRISDNGALRPAASKAPVVLMQPFSAVKAKQSPPAVYEALYDKLPAETQFIITGTPDDLGRNPQFNPLLARQRVDFDGSRFADIQDRIRAADLVVSVDTAMVHLAITLGAPTLCLASAAYVGEIVPYAPEIMPENACFYFIPMACQGCLGNCIHAREDNMFPCVAKLDPNKIIELSLKILKPNK